MKFNLETKTAKDEIYRADLGQGLSAVVAMHFHTFLKYWAVIYTIRYPPNFRSSHLFGKEVPTRKEARKIAQQIMDDAKPDDWKTKLDAFNRSNIRASISGTPNFMNI